MVEDVVGGALQYSVVNVEVDAKIYLTQVVNERNLPSAFEYRHLNLFYLKINNWFLVCRSVQIVENRP